jgi:hypothetical protein
MGGLGAFAEVLNRATLGVGGVWDVYSLSDVEDCIAANGDRVDASEACDEAKKRAWSSPMMWSGGQRVTRGG